MNKKQEALSLLKNGGKDKDLMLLDKINALSKKLEAVKKEFSGKEMKLDNFEAVNKIVDNTLKNIKGDKGDKGEKGEVGKSGTNGIDGIDGKVITGIDGVDGKNGKDGIDGKNGTNGIDGKNGIDGGNGLDGIDSDEEAILENLENNLPKLGGKIRDSLELLQGDDRLEMSAILDLEKELKKIKKSKSVGGGGARSASYIATDVTNFDNNLSSTDTTVQLALDTLNAMVGGTATGDVDGGTANSIYTSSQEVDGGTA